MDQECTKFNTDREQEQHRAILVFETTSGNKWFYIWNVSVAKTDHAKYVAATIVDQAGLSSG